MSKNTDAISFLSGYATQLARNQRVAQACWFSDLDPFRNNWDSAVLEAAKQYGDAAAICAELHLRKQGKLKFLGDLPTRRALYELGAMQSLPSEATAH